ncbi:MAG: hypothetical protein KAI83_04800 [Thiomargarita sp.]|nr:hypothetical protein [Thiomargarita sp.]
MNRTSQFIFGSAFFFILICTVWLYWGGLYGTYLLDDSPNLEDLSSVQNINDISKFVTEGLSSQFGRPISLLSFALQAHNWPSNPWAFKYVNLMIHLLNGCLIFWLIFSLTRLMKWPERRSLLLALLTASLWLWHPLQISTVLYVIQRMTQLSALFTLAGLLVYLQGRQRLAQGQLKSGFFWVSIGVGLGGILATLSKENGILLVLYIVVLEITVLHTLPKPRYWRVWSWVFLYFPLFLLAFHFAAHVDSLLRAYEIRDFTMGERLLTQARVLSDYLTKILFPRPQAFSLFQDDFPISHHLLKPATTLIAVSFIVIMFMAAIGLRRKYPLFSLGVLWFLAGHILESSFIGLVIAFEHRNYLPSLGILFAVIYSILWLFDQILTSYLRKAAIFFSALWFSIAPVITYSETNLWGKPFIQAVLWAEQKPLSRYAQSHAAAFFSSRGDFSQVEKYHRQMVNVFPQDASPYLLWLTGVCMDDKVMLPDIEKVVHHLETSKIDIAVGTALNVIAGRVAANQCDRLSSKTMHRLFKSVLKNPTCSFYQDDIFFIYGKFYARQKNYDMAVQMAEKSAAVNDTAQLKMQRLLWLIKANRFEDALSYIKQMREELNPISRRLYAEQLNFFESLASEFKKRFDEIKQNRILEENKEQ